MGSLGIIATAKDSITILRNGKEYIVKSEKDLNQWGLKGMSKSQRATAVKTLSNLGKKTDKTSK